MTTTQATVLAQLDHQEEGRPTFSHLATISDRVTARLIDSGLVLMLVLVASAIGWILILAEGLKALPFVLFLYFMAGLLVLGHEVVFTAERGQTMGKKFMKIKVVDTSTGGHPSAVSSLVRCALPGIASIVPFGAAVVYLSATFAGAVDRRGWHDRAASTVVVRA